MLRALTLVSGIVSSMVVAAVLGCAPALADSTVTVRGTAFPQGREAALSFVGCSSLYDRTNEIPRPFVSLGPGTPPTGTRSLGYDLAGGNAIGSLHYVSSLAHTTVAGLSVYADQAASGVAYVGYQAPADRGTTLVWFGRVALAAAPGSWHSIEATTQSYEWTKYDMATRLPVESGAAFGATTLPAFLALQGGDGPGFFTIGFGCNSAAFTMDGWRIGAPGNLTTYDLEGLTTTTSLAGGRREVVAGGTSTIAGALRDGGGNPLAEATLILEAKPFGAKDFETVQVVDAGGANPTVEVTPTTRTVYRWRFAGRPLAEASVSGEFTVEVATEVAAEPGVSAPDQVPVVSGTTSPAKPGVIATLWRMTPKGPLRVDNVKVAPDGTYGFELDTEEPGPGRYFVTVPAATGNLAGHSPTVSVVVPAPTK